MCYQCSQYDQHIKKLNRIYDQRRSQLGYNSLRMKEFNHIKENKTKSFIYQYNKKADLIAKSNKQILGKLEKVKPSLIRKTTFDEPQRTNYSFIKPTDKQYMLET